MSNKNYFLSELLGASILDKNNRNIGKITDIIIASKDNAKVIGIQIKKGKSQYILNAQSISIQKFGGKWLNQCKEALNITPPEESIALKKQVLDKQIVDIGGKKIVRVNDVQLSMVQENWQVVAVDVGIDGLFRRLGIETITNAIGQAWGRKAAGKFILWRDMEALIPPYNSLKVATTASKLSTLHPSELADIIEDLDINTSVAIISALDESHAADVLEELKPTAQSNILQALPLEKAADLLESMPADEVADILDDLSVSKAQELLEEMDTKASKEVLELMEHPEHTVGAIMSHDFMSIGRAETSDAIIEKIRQEKPEADAIQCIYVVGDDNKLLGTISIHRLITATDGAKATDIMHTPPIHMVVDESIYDCTKTMVKYNLLAVPVVEQDNTLVGNVIITDIAHNLTKTKRG